MVKYLIQSAMLSGCFTVLAYAGLLGFWTIGLSFIATFVLYTGAAMLRSMFQ